MREGRPVMKIAIVGPGALGCLLAASFAKKFSPSQIWLLDHDEERAAFLASQGIFLEKEGNKARFSVSATADPQRIGPAGYIFLCVKSYSMPDCLSMVRHLCAPGSLLLALQNGISHLGLLDSYTLPGQYALGVTSLGANLAGPGHVRFGGAGLTRMGFSHTILPGWRKRLKKIAQLMDEAGLACEVSPAILTHVWNKLLVNVGINALTAITNCANGELVHDAGLLRDLKAAVQEAAAVARAKGIDVDPDPVQMTLDVCAATASNISSMLQDVRNRRLTEIEAINGAIVRQAIRLHIDAPVNEKLVRKIHEIEQGYLPVFP
jgi:2-dehydropantoate 2-reductase